MQCLRLLIPLLFLCYLGGSAQQSGILTVKKGNRVVKRFFKDNSIAFFTTEGFKVEAQISRITTDSLFLTYYDVGMFPTPYGTYRRDTLGRYPMFFSLKNIGAFPKPRAKGNIITNGSLFMLGGGAYTVLNIFNTVREGDPPFGEDNLPNVIAGVSTFAFGYLLSRLKKDRIYIGKRYRLEVIP